MLSNLRRVTDQREKISLGLALREPYIQFWSSPGAPCLHAL